MDTSWMELALCVQLPGWPWIVEPHHRSPAAATALGAVCLVCPVRVDCEQYIAAAGIVSGFWAGQDRTPAEDYGTADGAA